MSQSNQKLRPSQRPQINLVLRILLAVGGIMVFLALFFIVNRKEARREQTSQKEGATSFVSVACGDLDQDDGDDDDDDDDDDDHIDSSDQTGLKGGHFDVDTYSAIAPVNNGETDGHVHEYDNKYDVVGVDYFNLRDSKLHNIDQDISKGSQKFKIIIANADLSPGGRLVINNTYDPNDPSTYIPVKTYDDIPLDQLPVYSLDGVSGTTKLSKLGIYFEPEAIQNNQLIPTNTGDVKKNVPGLNGEWRNGALTIQALAVNNNGSDAFTTDAGKSAGGVQGVATSGLLWESTIFWHWDGKSYHENPSYTPGKKGGKDDDGDDDDDDDRDSDCDGVPNSQDLYAGANDKLDTDGDGIPDCVDWEGFDALPDEWKCGNGKKVQICHVPNGNPENRKTICISASAVEKHLKNHPGDHLGPCDAQVCDDDPCETGPGSDAAVPGRKQAGFAWEDINQDGYVDLMVNTQLNKSSGRTRIIMSDPSDDPANPVLRDMTDTYCKSCRKRDVSRSALMADVNNDGYVDLLRNDTDWVEVYLNRGPAEGYVFGIGPEHEPNFTLHTDDPDDPTKGDIPGGMNVEGMFLADYNNDGWLDLVLENDKWGIDLFQNPADGTANFFFVNPKSVGLPTTAQSGDYGSAVDFDNDGDLDFVARKNGAIDFYVNENGHFSGDIDLGNTSEDNPGGVSFGDFDNDGDFDLYWTDEGSNQIWINEDGHLRPTDDGSGVGEPWKSAGMSAASGTDGVAVGDINNDGKVDLFISGSSGASYLFLNTSQDRGELSFVHDNMGINVDGDAEGAAFVDYDNDGDMDLYVNVDDGKNQLWRNGLNNKNFLRISLLKALGQTEKGAEATTYRTAVGANVSLLDCNGNVVSGIREVSTGTGHGTDPADVVHFGLPYGPYLNYTIVASFVAENGQRKVVKRSLIPADLPGQQVTIKDTDPDDVGFCTLLPVELTSFTARMYGGMGLLEWKTDQNQTGNHFVVERSLDGSLFETIGQVPMKGSNEARAYSFKDPLKGFSEDQRLYYRLKVVSLDGKSSYSPLVELAIEESLSLSAVAYPNPAKGRVKVKAISGGPQFVTARILNGQGKTVWEKEVEIDQGETVFDVSVSGWTPGLYIISIVGENYQAQQNLIVN
ncbi:MAG: T9SS C-terminal target domain-containing protein [Bacteroidetes bacterium]|nr:MAG: T9SS C-terminal target domain-containing protein [Bacteroidota bacterium]